MKKTLFAIMLFYFLPSEPITIAAGNNYSPWLRTSDWKDGIEIIRNSKEPLHRNGSIRFADDLIIGSEGDPEKLISIIGGIVVDDSGDIFIVDTKESRILKYDAKGNYITKFGTHGQGPGEFESPAYITMSAKGELFIRDSKRFSVFSQEGRYLRGYPSSILNEIERCAIDRNGNGYGVRLLLLKKPPYTRELIKFDSNFKSLRTFETYEIPYSRDESIDPFRPSLMNVALTEEGLVMVATQDRYEIRFFDADGQLKKRILKDYDPVPVTKRDKDAILEGAPDSFVRNFRPSEYFPAWKKVFCGSKGRIFVETYERALYNDAPHFDIFDSRGRFFCKASIAGITTLYLKNDYVYMLDVTDEGYHVIRRKRIVWSE